MQIKWSISLKKETLIPPILAYEGMLYIQVENNNGVGALWAFDAENGKVKWKFGKFREYIDTEVAVIDGHVLVLNGGNLYFVDGRRGKELKRIKNRSLSLPVLRDGLLYLSTDDNHYLSAMDIKTGAFIWRSPIKGKGTKSYTTVSYQNWEGWINSSPVLINDAVCVSVLAQETSSEKKNLVYCVDKNSGKKKWQFVVDCDRLHKYISAFKDNVYFIDGFYSRLHVLDWKTGRKKGEFDIYLNSNRPADPPVIVDDLLYIKKSDNIYALNSNNCQELWHKKTDCVWSKPSIWGPLLFFPNESKKCLVAVDRKTGRQKWTFVPEYPKKPGALTYWFGDEPTFTNDVLCVCCGENSIYAIDASSGDIKGEFFLVEDIELHEPIANNGSIYCLAGENRAVLKQCFALSIIA